MTRPSDMWITGSAIRVLEGEVYSLPSPARHGHVMRLVAEERPGWRLRQGDEQGFVTECGRFLTRKQAHTVARANGQLPGGKLKHCQSVFTSEELW